MKKTIRLIALSLVLVIAMMALASCGKPNADPAKAKAALEEAGYTATLINSGFTLTGASAVYGGNVKAVVTGVKLADKEAVQIIYYNDADSANSAFENVKEYAEKQNNDEDSKIEIKKSGNMIWFGTKEAIKAAA